MILLLSDDSINVKELNYALIMTTCDPEPVKEDEWSDSDTNQIRKWQKCLARDLTDHFKGWC
jgi:hypothetical protein